MKGQALLHGDAFCPPGGIREAGAMNLENLTYEKKTFSRVRVLKRAVSRRVTVEVLKLASFCFLFAVSLQVKRLFVVVAGQRGAG